MTDEQDYISVASSAEAPDSWDSRTLRLLGPDAADVLAHARVLVAGVGGVGGYVVEMLARSGVGHLVLVDSDTVAESNLNRQIIALRSTLGKPKVELFAARVADINPDCRVETLQRFLTPDNVEEILCSGFDFVADCIDTVAPKVALLSACRRRGIRVVSSMGPAAGSTPRRCVTPTSGRPVRTAWPVPCVTRSSVAATGRQSLWSTVPRLHAHARCSWNRGVTTSARLTARWPQSPPCSASTWRPTSYANSPEYKRLFKKQPPQG